MKTKIIIGAVIILVLLAIVAALKGWYADLPKLTTQWLTAPEIQTTTKIPKAKVSVKKIITLEKKEVSKKLKLPEAVAQDETKQITATAEIPAYEGKTDVAAIMTIVDGEGKTEIIAKQQPLSLFALENKRAIGLRYGYGVAAKSDIQSGMQADIYGRWDVVRIGSVHVGFYGEVTTTGDGRAMLNVEYRF